MVEGEGMPSPIVDPCGPCGIRARAWSNGARQQGEIGNADRVAARVALRIGIDTD